LEEIAYFVSRIPLWSKTQGFYIGSVCLLAKSEKKIVSDEGEELKA
jgi:hypothetical protein